jgi:hypothetical protein
MEEYCWSEGLKRISKTHKEIYLSDARKTLPKKLKTILWIQDKKANERTISENRHSENQ